MVDIDCSTPTRGEIIYVLESRWGRIRYLDICETHIFFVLEDDSKFGGDALWSTVNFSGNFFQIMSLLADSHIKRLLDRDKSIIMFNSAGGDRDSQAMLRDNPVLQDIVKKLVCQLRGNSQIRSKPRAPPGPEFFQLMKQCLEAYIIQIPIYTWSGRSFRDYCLARHSEMESAFRNFFVGVRRANRFDPKSCLLIVNAENFN